MTRILWLAFERPPHPDAVRFPAGETDLEFVLEYLALPARSRRHITQQLRNYLAEQKTASPFARKNVPCRRSSGLYQLVPWRLAKWLSHVLPADESKLRETASKIRDWLHRGDDKSAAKRRDNPNRQLAVE